ncbi:MAG: YabP/YqfC family sporulation protein [Clostridia bacterium]
MKSFEQDLATALGVEIATLIGAYKYSVYGGSTFVLEGMNGIRYFSAEKIIFSIKKQTLAVKGQGLTIKQLTRDYAVVTGQIGAVEVVL